MKVASVNVLASARLKRNQKTIRVPSKKKELKQIKRKKNLLHQ